MLKITHVAGTPDQFTATLDNLDIFAIDYMMNKALEGKGKKDLEDCNCGKCQHMLSIFNELQRAMKMIDEFQSKDLSSKWVDLLLKNIGRPSKAIEINPNSPEGKKLLELLKSLGI